MFHVKHSCPLLELGASCQDDKEITTDAAERPLAACFVALRNRWSAPPVSAS